MNIVKLLPAVVGLMLCLTSCGTVRTSKAYDMPVRMELQMDDLVFLGVSEISYQYDTYFGCIRTINMVNGKIYNPGNDTELSLPMGHLPVRDKGMSLAAAKCLADYPEAEYFQVVMDTKQTDRLILGSSTTRTVKVRCYKFK